MSSEKLGPAFAGRLLQARQLAASFAEATDELNAALLEAEAAFAELRLGVSASVVIDSGDIEGSCTGWVQLLAFCKTGRGWKLSIQNGPDDDYESLLSNPVCDTSRETRLLAAKHLPQLLEELIKNADAAYQDVRSSTNDVKGLVHAIRGGAVSK